MKKSIHGLIFQNSHFFTIFLNPVPSCLTLPNSAMDYLNPATNLNSFISTRIRMHHLIIFSPQYQIRLFQLIPLYKVHVSFHSIITLPCLCRSLSINEQLLWVGHPSTEKWLQYRKFRSSALFTYPTDRLWITGCGVWSNCRKPARCKAIWYTTLWSQLSHSIFRPTAIPAAWRSQVIASARPNRELSASRFGLEVGLAPVVCVDVEWCRWAGVGVPADFPANTAVVAWKVLLWRFCEAPTLGPHALEGSGVGVGDGKTT